MKLQLHVDDLRGLCALLGQLAGRTDHGLTERRALYFTGLANLISADRWYFSHMRRNHGEGLTQFTRQFGGAWRSETQTHNVEAISEYPDFTRVMVQPVNGIYERHCTVCRADYVPADTWQNFSFYQKLFKPVGIADLMYSLYPAGDGFFSVLVVYRPTLRTPFGPRERDLMHFAMQLVDYLLVDGAKVDGAETVIDLSPRERAVLIRLLAGDSVKQIATSLDVSHHTVNDHLKSLHKRFKVNSRAELLAKFIAREHRLKSP